MEFVTAEKMDRERERNREREREREGEKGPIYLGVAKKVIKV